MKKIFEKIRTIVERDGGVHSDYLVYLTEEVGEVAAAVSVYRGTKDKVLKETVEQECCDVIITALATIAKFNPDWTLKDIKNYMEEKINRWDSHVHISK